MKGKRVKFLYLSEPDMIKAGVLDMHKCVETMVETFELVGKGDYLMGGPGENHHGMMIYFPKERRFPNMPVAGPDRRFMAMVAYLGGRFNVCGEKWYGSNVENPTWGLPRSILLVVLNDPATSEPLAIMSANLISAMRTGAIPGVAARYLARKNSEVIGIIGGGVISKACLMALVDVLENAREVRVYDIVRSKAEEFSKQMSEQLKVDVHPVDSMEQAVVDCDVVNVATAGEAMPYVKTEWLKEGSMLSLPAGIKLDEELLLTSKVVVDNWKMHAAWRDELEEYEKGSSKTKIVLGTSYLFKLIEDGKIYERDIVSLGQVAIGEKPGRVNDKESTVCMMGGMPVEDVAWGYAVYQEALRQGIGQELTLWEEPYWF
ncbi:MAG: ornithine cyclodeaminase [Firmicutes bacterium]|nr:ornithine cyclodeaminase [Bacillota bacterium]